MGRRIIIAGGGTGGHIFPALAIAGELKKQDPAIELLFVGAKGRMEMEKVPQAGYLIEGLDIAGLNRSSLIKNIGLPLKLIRSWFQVKRIFKTFSPHAVIGVGGYSSFPVLRFAQTKGIPTFIHESNSFAGKANIMLGKRATAVFVATGGMEKFFPKDRIQITGNPVRPAIVTSSNISKQDAVREFGLNATEPVLLVVGGSLGARSINEAIGSGLDRLRRAGLQVIWQTGKSDAEKWKLMGSGKEGVWVSHFITNMERGYAAADLVVSRAGAMAIAELCIVGKPVVFVPYPHAAEDHQTANAMDLVNGEAGLMVKDNEAGERLVDEVIRLQTNSELKSRISNNIKKKAVTNADERVATAILKQI